MKIVKIGGSKINSNKDLKNLFNLLENSNEPNFFIISAFGKTTSNLLKAINYSSNKNIKYKQILNQIFHFHLDLFDFDIKYQNLIFNKFLIFNTFFDAIFTLNNISEKTKDKILSFGETLALDILEFYIKENNFKNIKIIPAIDFIITDENYGNASILYENTKNNLNNLIRYHSNSYNSFLTQGFIGKSLNNNLTTLGLESSNYTAVVIAKILNSKAITFITDTDGIYDSDPRYFENYNIIKSLNYRESLFITNLGLKLINDKMLKIASKANIILYYTTFINFKNEPFTIIDKYSDNLINTFFLLDVKHIKFSIFPEIKLIDKSEFFIVNNNYYCNSRYLSYFEINNFIELVKFTVYNFKCFKFNEFHLKFNDIIDNIVIDSNLKIIIIYFNKNKIISLFENKEDYLFNEKIFYEQLKEYFI